jgi:hypothetical protein
MRVGVQVVQPVFNSDLYTRFTKNRPSRHNDTFGQGDTTIAPLVVGYKGKADFIGEFAPTSSYRSSFRPVSGSMKC